MATYKIPQDVEAEDKLLGPFSLKQVIFILIFFGACWLAYVLSKILLPFGLLMLPIIIVSGVLGFVQRKDQPVEVFLAALIRFNTKTRKRVWDQTGYEHRVYITAPKKVEQQRFRNITQDEVHNRLGSIANLMDSRGWAAKGLASLPSDRLIAITSPKAEMENAISSDIQQQQAQVSQKFDQLLQERTNASKVAAIERMMEVKATSLNDRPSADVPAFNPYPANMRQKVLTPAPTGADTTATTSAQITTDLNAQAAVPQQVSPDIIRLAYNKDRTVDAIAREAHALPSEEVVVSLH